MRVAFSRVRPSCVCGLLVELDGQRVPKNGLNHPFIADLMVCTLPQQTSALVKRQNASKQKTAVTANSRNRYAPDHSEPVDAQLSDRSRNGHYDGEPVEAQLSERLQGIGQFLRNKDKIDALRREGMDRRKERAQAIP
jgi:hypothetical protein